MELEQKEYCLCGCGQEIKYDKSMISDGFGWMLYNCVEKIRNGKTSKSGYSSPDGVRVVRKNIFNIKNRVNLIWCGGCEYKNRKEKSRCLDCFNYNQGM